MRMKMVHWSAALVGALTAGILIHCYFPSNSEQMAAIAPVGRAIRDWDKWPARTDGGVDYLAKMAIAKSKINEKHPLVSYKPTPGVEGSIALDKIYFGGIPATAQSVDAARSLLNSGRLSPEEMYSMIRIVASLYNRENSSGANADIALDLKMLTTNPNKQIAGRAAISYARLEYLPGMELVLKKTFENGALPVDTYYQELAHLVTSAPPEKQKEFLAEILASKNRLATDVLMVALNSGEEFNAAPFLKSSEDMAALLRANEPGFNYGVGMYGGVDAVRYKEWIRASAAIESAKTGRGMDDLIVAKLSEPGTDPRKIMAYLSSSEAMPLLADAPPQSQVQKLAAIAREHASQNPANSDMTDTAMLIMSRMRNPPPALPKPVFAMPTGPVPGPQPMPQGSAAAPR